MAAWLIAGVLLAVSTGWAAPKSTGTIPARRGVIRVMPIFHASTQLEYDGKVIIIDPVSAGSYTKKADLILITHTHPDHLDLAAINKVGKPTVSIIAPPAIAQTIESRNKFFATAMNNGDRLSFRKTAGDRRNSLARMPGLAVEAVPMYNLKRGPQAGQKFHPKGLGNGYILTLGGRRIYIAGDTEATPEMKRLKNIDAAFLPMNLPYTMTPQEAAAGARAFRPRIVFPYHYRFPFDKPNSNPEQFAAALRGTNIQVWLLEWYPAKAVAKAMAAMKKQ